MKDCRSRGSSRGSVPLITERHCSMRKLRPVVPGRSSSIARSTSLEYPPSFFRTSTAHRSTSDCSSGFVVLVGARGDAWLSAAVAAAEHYGVQVAAQQIGGLSDLQEDGRDWESIYGIADDGAVLVRPDGHIGARFARAPSSHERALSEALRQILSRGVRARSLTHSGEMH